MLYFIVHFMWLLALVFLHFMLLLALILNNAATL